MSDFVYNVSYIECGIISEVGVGSGAKVGVQW